VVVGAAGQVRIERVPVVIEGGLPRKRRPEVSRYSVVGLRSGRVTGIHIVLAAATREAWIVGAVEIARVLKRHDFVAEEARLQMDLGAEHGEVLGGVVIPRHDAVKASRERKPGDGAVGELGAELRLFGSVLVLVVAFDR